MNKYKNVLEGEITKKIQRKQNKVKTTSNTKSTTTLIQPKT